MNKFVVKNIVILIFAFLSPYLTKLGLNVPLDQADRFADLVQTVTVAVAGILSSGVRFGIQDTRTTIFGLLSAATYALAAFGIEISEPGLAALRSLILMILGWLQLAPGTVSLQVRGGRGE